MKRLGTPVVWTSALLSSLVLNVGIASADPGQVSFDQVLATPDDVKLNVQYAEEQANAGHLLEAAAALERILLVEPNRADVRLLYAVVLYRLDDIQNAAAQLAQVDDSALSPLQKAEAGDYRRLIEGRSRRGIGGARIGGQIAAGFVYDSDAAGAVQTQLQFSPFQPVDRQWGEGSVISGDVHMSIPVGPGENTSVIGSLSGYDREKTAGGQDELQTVDARLGLSVAEGPSVTLSAVGVARSWRVLNKHLLDEFGGRGQLAWRATSATKVVLAVEGVQQTYFTPNIYYLVNDNGPRYDLEVDVSHRLSATSTFLVGVGYENKLAGYRPWGYQAGVMRGRWDQALARGTYLVATAELWSVQYDGPDTLLFWTKRRDTRPDARIAFGVPFSAFAPEGATGDWREKLAFEVAAAYANRDTNRPVASYTDNSVEARLVWRFGAQD